MIFREARLPERTSGFFKIKKPLVKWFHKRIDDCCSNFLQSYLLRLRKFRYLFHYLCSRFSFTNFLRISGSKHSDNIILIRNLKNLTPSCSYSNRGPKSTNPFTPCRQHKILYKASCRSEIFISNNIRIPFLDTTANNTGAFPKFVLWFNCFLVSEPI